MTRHGPAHPGTARSGSVEIAWLADGDPDLPVVLLVAGSDATADRWSPELVERLLLAGRRVVRYDHRDTGRSTRVPPEEQYGLDALVADAVAVLDAVGVDAAHVLGHSMGGMVAQLMALEHPDRVSSAVLVATSPGPADGLSATNEGYEGALLELMWAPPPRSAEGRVGRHIELAELLSGTLHSPSGDERRLTAEREVARGWEPETGHGQAVAAAPRRIDRLESIAIPTVVLHGDADPVFGVDHAEALAHAIPGSTLRVVPGWGHDLPASIEPILVDSIEAVIELSASGPPACG